MGQTIVGLFIHSDAADLAAATLVEEHNLTGDELDIMMPSYAPIANQYGDANPVAKRWGDRVRAGEWAVVARTNDPDEAQAVIRSLRESGAHRVDLLAD